MLILVKQRKDPPSHLNMQLMDIGKVFDDMPHSSSFWHDSVHNELSPVTSYSEIMPSIFDLPSHDRHQGNLEGRNVISQGNIAQRISIRSKFARI